MPTVLVVEDDRKLRRLLRSYLEAAGMSVLTAGTGAEALELVADAQVDLVLLDLGLPDIAGEEVAREARQRWALPVIMLTARSSDDDRIAGLELGVDDYVTKPFVPREVVLRVQAVLRRHTSDVEASVVSFGDGQLTIDTSRREVLCGQEPVHLTPTEWDLLTALAGSPGRVYSRTELINRARGYELDSDRRTVDSHVKNLRRKIEVDPTSPRIVETVLGGGYRLGLRRDG